MRTHASRPRRGWLLLAVLLPLLCLAGCAARMSRSPAADRAGAASPSLVLPVATFTPVVTPSPTFTTTSTPTPTLLPTPTPTLLPTLTGPATPTPSQTRFGAYDNLTEHPDGRYALQRAGPRVAARFSTARSPVQYAAWDVPQPLFTVPEPFRPPYPVLRTAVGTPVRVDGTPDPDHPESRRFLLRVEPDGAVHYVDDGHVEGVGYLAYALDTVWGTTPAANDFATLEILATTLGSLEGGLGSNPTTGSGITVDHQGRVTALRWPYRKLRGALPPEIGELHKLQILDLAANQITSLPPEIGQFSQLQTLNLWTNRLTSLPPELGQLSQLQYLGLEQNRLTGIPPELGQLSQLQTLDLAANQITSLPPEIGQLSQLQILRLGFNRLTSLPPELGQLSQLQYLGLERNQLTEIPPELGQLPQVKEIRLFDNPVACLPPSWRGKASISPFQEDDTFIACPPGQSHPNLDSGDRG